MRMKGKAPERHRDPTAAYAVSASEECLLNE